MVFFESNWLFVWLSMFDVEIVEILIGTVSSTFRGFSLSSETLFRQLKFFFQKVIVFICTLKRSKVWSGSTSSPVSFPSLSFLHQRRNSTKEGWVVRSKCSGISWFNEDIVRLIVRDSRSGIPRTNSPTTMYGVARHGDVFVGDNDIAISSATD